MKMKNLEVRKVIAVGSFVVVSAIACYCTVTGKEINNTAMLIVSSLLGAINWYFAKSTALEQPKKDGEI